MVLTALLKPLRRGRRNRRKRLVGELCGANFHDTNFAGAILDGADLRGADLRAAVGLTAEQLEGAVLDESTRLPPQLR
jgi:hypothetical protein